MNDNHDRRCLVELTHVTKQFQSNGSRHTALHSISLKAYTGELLLLLGPSGSGKTTLLTTIAGLMPPTSGQVRLFGRKIEQYSKGELQQLRSGKLGFVFQTFHLIDYLTALENVALVLRFAGEPKGRARKQAGHLLRQLRIEHLAGKLPPRMSQGEKQRVAVARAIACGADLILADEPTASLESSQGFEIIRLLYRYARNHNKCVIVASHDQRIRQFAHRILRLDDGVLSECAAVNGDGSVRKAATGSV
ncbi:MAG: ABC transporter ATP-binding protein [Candidatus Zixiibacteriota bacterium]|nr:MAG: ABC transporter ATP-binding protein [candidate division Zixibacteria bacterium]